MGSIRVSVSPGLREACRGAVQGSGDVPGAVLAAAEGAGAWLGVPEVRWLQEHLPPDVHVHELLRGCEVCLPGLQVPQRDPQLEARVLRLRAEQAAREYRAMTRNVDSAGPHQYHRDDSLAYQMKQINRQLIAVFQFVVSVAAGFAFGFVGVELMVGQLEFGFRLLLGVMCALVIALAEMYFLAKKLNEDLAPPPAPVKQHSE
ncbi:transmembrane protein 199 [Bacillus rossius redtenbacheri]|uniref:transmembrane protein 199 n=1 Tax=Bacillus rossius redtenbacheri TaxID=93214 RepID=UPI002FDC92BE